MYIINGYLHVEKYYNFKIIYRHNVGVANFIWTWFLTWQWSDLPVEYVNQIPWTPQTNREYSFIIHTFRLNLEIRVELYSRHYA